MQEDFLSRLREIPGFSADKALAALGCSPESYERIVRVTARLLPDNIGRMQAAFDSGSEDYPREVHGLKGVLRNIGADELGEAAQRLEENSKRGIISADEHNALADRLRGFTEALSQALPEKTSGGVRDAAMLRKIEDAVKNYDCLTALRILRSGGELNDMWQGLSRALETFNVENAEEWICKLKQCAIT